MDFPVEVKVLSGYRIWLRYDDGVEGEVNLEKLAGRGVFEAWSNRGFFESVHLSDHGAVAWGKDIDLCPDALYMQLAGKSVEEIFPCIRAPRSPSAFALHRARWRRGSGPAAMETEKVPGANPRCKSWALSGRPRNPVNGFVVKKPSAHPTQENRIAL